MQSEIEIFITNLDKKNIVNQKTGELTNWCMVTYMIKKEDTDKSIGVAHLSCYCKPNAWNDLKPYMFKWTKAFMTQVVENNRIKLKIKQIDKYLLS